MDRDLSGVRNERETFDDAWSRCADWIAAANQYALGTHTLDDVKAQVIGGEAYFWPGERSAVVGEIYDLPQMRVFHFWLCGGDLIELVETMRPRIEDWAIAQGCSRITTAGRVGWQRVMARHGYAPLWHVCAKDVM